ncbi:MAG: adenosylcobinamide-GDP ribazoletransferase [Magnetococcales bacterium]|nr:adenosylcobinamide-GDP ribazoletransferase [Magnetococcales bacterium]
MTPVGRAWRLALGLLTRLPVRAVPQPVSGVDFGRSVLFYPLVGLLVGLGVAGVAWLTQSAGDALHAALVLMSWVAWTGALHLDGLADWTDAAIGGLGDRQRTLEIMKDPRSGPAAVTAVALLLLLKFAALMDLLPLGQAWWSLATIPVVGRGVLVVLFLTTPYANPQGMAAEAVQNLPRKVAILILGLIAVSIGLLHPFPVGWLILGTAGFIFLLLRGIYVRRVQGFTGDIAGAMCEITETALLVLLAWLGNAPAG